MKDRVPRTTPVPTDILPLPDSLKSAFRDVMVAHFGSRMGDREFELLWQMIVSATWEYRQTAPLNQLDVQATLSRGVDLSHQIFTQLRLDPNDTDFVFRTMINLGACAGFFGLHFDRWMLTSLADENWAEDDVNDDQFDDLK